jgi:hypothetical protein
MTSTLFFKSKTIQTDVDIDEMDDSFVTKSDRRLDTNHLLRYHINI